MMSANILLVISILKRYINASYNLEKVVENRQPVALAIRLSEWHKPSVVCCPGRTTPMGDTTTRGHYCVFGRRGDGQTPTG